MPLAHTPFLSFARIRSQTAQIIFQKTGDLFCHRWTGARESGFNVLMTGARENRDPEELARRGTAESSLTDFVDGLVPSGGDVSELNAALPAIYDDLREIASSYLRRERPDHTLQPTALVHESYLRLLDQHAVNWNNRLHVLSIAARMMRRILSNYATARATAKRGQGEACLEIDAALEIYDQRAVSIESVDDALRGLEAMDPRQARVVELRFFGGLTMEEIAEVLGLSLATVKRDWLTARRWLKREMSGRI